MAASVTSATGAAIFRIKVRFTASTTPLMTTAMPMTASDSSTTCRSRSRVAVTRRMAPTTLPSYHSGAVTARILSPVRGSLPE